MYFSIENDDILKKCKRIRKKFSNNIKKEFDSKPNYHKKFMPTKIKPYCQEVTDVHDKEMRRIGSNCILNT